MSKYDIIIIGGGHNSLICASYLAKRNFKILILEKNEQVGGLAHFREFFINFQLLKVFFSSSRSKSVKKLQEGKVVKITQGL